MAFVKFFKVNCLIGFFLMPLFLPFSFLNTVHADISFEPPVPEGSFTPSPDAIMILGFCFRSGFTRQPTVEQNYVTADHPKIKLKGTADRTLASSTLFTRVQYTWYEASDNENWHPIDNSNENTFTFDPSQEKGNHWYQLKTSYITPHLVGKDSEDPYFSKIVHINVSPQPVPTDQITVTTDSKYLFNVKSDFDNNITYARSILSPINSTSSTIWHEIVNSNLASFSSDGKIVANTNGVTGDFTITGEISNALLNHPPVYDQDTIRIGGGLDDQTVPIRHPATFELQGDYFQNLNSLSKLNISWYRNNKKIPGATGFSYKTPQTTNKDDGAKYHMEINTKINNKVLRFKSNDATLKVIPDEDPDVTIKSTVKNNTFVDNNNTDSHLFSVAPNDQLTYNFKLVNNSGHDITDSKLTFPIYPQTQIESVTLTNHDNLDLPYSINNDDTSPTITITVNNLGAVSDKDIQIKTIVPIVNNQYHQNFQSIYTGTDSKNNNYQNYGPNLSINYITNIVQPHVKDISFEPIKMSEYNVLKHRLNDDDDDLISIVDGRRNKTPIKLFLLPTVPLKDSAKNILPADLLYYHQNKVSNTSTDKVSVAESVKDQPLQAPKWSHDEGLLLHVKDSNIAAGSYSTQLNWSVQDSI